MTPEIAVVIVLYHQKISQSPSYDYLRAATQAGTVELVIFDNSPVAHADVLYSEKNVHYHHDPANPGLAVAYNYAIDHVSDTVQTLITLDQDTQLGTDYLKTVAELPWTKERVAAVPLVFSGTKQISPVWADHYINRHFEVIEEPVVTRQRIMAINSGAAFSLTFLREINGYNTVFPLDFLDHWLFWQIKQLNKEIVVLATSMTHDLSVLDDKKVNVTRYQSILAAESIFYQEYDRQHLMPHRKQLVLRMTKQFLTVKNRQIWRMTLRSFVDNWKV